MRPGRCTLFGGLIIVPVKLMVSVEGAVFYVRTLTNLAALKHFGGVMCAPANDNVGRAA